jgi:hypothetical protein
VTAMTFRERYDRWREETVVFGGLPSTAMSVSVFGASYAILAALLYIMF